MLSHRVVKRMRAICAGVTAILLLCSCGQAAEEDEIIIVDRDTSELAYDFAVAEIGDVVKTERIRCTYRQLHEQEVAFSLTGRLIDQVYVKEGDSVKKGDLLAELSSQSLERQIEDLKYRIARNELLLGYTNDDESYAISALWVNYLYFSGMSENDLKYLEDRRESIQQNYRYLREDYNDALEADRKELSKLQQELRASRVYAEIDGVIYDLKDRLEGSTSKADEVVMSILDTAECVFETTAPEAAGYFTEGVTVPMSLGVSTSGDQFELVPWNMDEWGENQWFSIFSGPDGFSLEVGASGNMQVVSDSRQNVLRVPTDAVYVADDQSYVYVVNSENLREVRWVTTGLYGDDAVEILSGLTEGERVILK